jgi:hypothetical protein
MAKALAKANAKGKVRKELESREKMKKILSDLSTQPEGNFYVPVLQHLQDSLYGHDENFNDDGIIPLLVPPHLCSALPTLILKWAKPLFGVLRSKVAETVADLRIRVMMLPGISQSMHLDKIFAEDFAVRLLGMLERRKCTHRPPDPHEPPPKKRRIQSAGKSVSECKDASASTTTHNRSLITLEKASPPIMPPLENEHETTKMAMKEKKRKKNPHSDSNLNKPSACTNRDTDNPTSRRGRQRQRDRSHDSSSRSRSRSRQRYRDRSEKTSKRGRNRRRRHSRSHSRSPSGSDERSQSVCSSESENAGDPEAGNRKASRQRRKHRQKNRKNKKAKKKTNRNRKKKVDSEEESDESEESEKSESESQESEQTESEESESESEESESDDEKQRKKRKKRKHRKKKKKEKEKKKKEKKKKKGKGKETRKGKKRKTSTKKPKRLTTTKTNEFEMKMRWFMFFSEQMQKKLLVDGDELIRQGVEIYPLQMVMSMEMPDRVMEVMAQLDRSSRPNGTDSRMYLDKDIETLSELVCELTEKYIQAKEGSTFDPDDEGVSDCLQYLGNIWSDSWADWRANGSGSKKADELQALNQHLGWNIARGPAASTMCIQVEQPPEHATKNADVEKSTKDYLRNAKKFRIIATLKTGYKCGMGCHSREGLWATMYDCKRNERYKPEPGKYMGHYTKQTSPHVRDHFRQRTFCEPTMEMDDDVAVQQTDKKLCSILSEMDTKLNSRSVRNILFQRKLD